MFVCGDLLVDLVLPMRTVVFPLSRGDVLQAPHFSILTPLTLNKSIPLYPSINLIHLPRIYSHFLFPSISLQEQGSHPPSQYTSAFEF